MNNHCPQCGFHNPPGMRFCGNCGARLVKPPVPDESSPDLSAQLTDSLQSPSSPASSSFSPESLGVMMGADLMERLRRAGIEAAGQRRNVTVLFTDLSGYTSMSEQVDGEDLYELVQQYIRLLINAVYKYEGIVDKLTGDGLMALFGAPIAHENNAERAVHAAIDMQAEVAQLSKETKARLGLELNMRVGLHSGLVVVGGVGSDMLMNYTAIGDTVNLAHRIEEAAAPNTILVSEAVYRQVRALFDCQQVSVLNPKGIARPVMAFRVLGPKARPGLVRGIEGLRAPMIGRDAELNQLKSAVGAMLTRRQGHFYLVTGEAGLGKSRLTAEFKASLSQLPLRVLEGQSLAYRRSIAYWIFQDLLFNYLGVAANTSPLQIRERLTQFTYQAMGNQAREVLPYLEHLLSLPYSDPGAGERLRYLDAGQLRQQIFLAIRDLLVSESYRRPLLLILEDLHWADEASLELMYFLLEALRSAPIFILGISRHVQDNTLHKAADWARQHMGERFRIIQLQSLSLDQSQVLLYELLTIPSLPESLRQQILTRAAGIPFYLEEILRMLIDEGAIRREDNQWRLLPGMESVSLRVPDTLQGLILTRFDRLEPHRRKLLQVASVIGKNFSLPVLNYVIQSEAPGEVHSALQELAEREFILPLAGNLDGEYTFRHILMSDAIYSTLLRRERSRLHGQVGQAIETLYADRLDGQIELLANHYRWSPQLDRALHFLILAGERAARNNVNEQARLHYLAAQEVLDQIEHQPYQALQVHMGLGDVLVFSGAYPEARQHFETALQAIAAEDGSVHAEERSALCRKLARTYERHGDYDQAVALLEDAGQALDCSPEPLPVERAQIWNDLGWIYFRRAGFTEAQQRLQDALQLAETTGAYDVVASIYNRLGGVAYNLGSWDQAAGFLRKSIAIRESIHDVVGLATSFNNLGLLEIEMGEFDNALDNLTRSYELKTRLGQAEGVATALHNLSWLRIQRGEIEEAKRTLAEALELARQIGYSSLLRQILKNLGELYLAAQDWEQARSVLGEIAPGLIELGARDELLDTYRLLGEACLGAGDLAMAQEWARQVDTLASQFDETKELSATLRGELWRFRAMLATRLGDWEAAQQALRQSEAVFQKLRSRLYQGRIAYQRGALAEAQGDWRNAQLRYREAALLFQSVGARLEEKRAEEARQRQLTGRNPA